MDAKEISKAVIKRLPRYYRYLGELMEEKVERISSNDLSKKMHVTASQIRQDLNNFGGFGQQGYGYNVEYLYTEIGKILGLDTIHPMIILGAGNLGQALANYGDFEKRGFRLVGIFDINPVLEGISVRGIEIRMINSLPEFIRENQVEIAILTLPKNKAKEMAKVLIDNGIKAIWNFAHTDLDASQKCRKGFQLFVYRQNQGCTAINGKHKKRGSAFHGSISPEQGMEPGPENFQTQTGKTTEEKRVFFHMLGLLG